jgi:hypothetical protein
MTADREPAETSVSGGVTTAVDGSDGDEAGDGDGGGYVHRPAGSPRPHQAPPSEEGFDWRGWLLVGVVVVAFLVVPTAILSLPQAQGLVTSLGLSLRDTYLVLPLIPAFLLGVVAVWAAVRSRT